MEVRSTRDVVCGLEMSPERRTVGLGGDGSQLQDLQRNQGRDAPPDEKPQALRPWVNRSKSRRAAQRRAATRRWPRWGGHAHGGGGRATERGGWERATRLKGFFLIGATALQHIATPQRDPRCNAGRERAGRKRENVPKAGAQHERARALVRQGRAPVSLRDETVATCGTPSVGCGGTIREPRDHNRDRAARAVERCTSAGT